MFSKRLFILTLLVGMLFYALPGLATAQERLVVYSARGEQFTKPLLRAFERATGIRTISLVGPGGQLLARLQEEGDRTEADIFLTNAVLDLEMARQAGLLMPMQVTGLSRIDEDYIGENQEWVALSLRARVLVLNRNLVAEGNLTSIGDLASPDVEGQVAITTSTNGSFVGHIAAMVHQDGEEATLAFLQRLRTNAGNNVFPKHTPLVSAVARGDVPIGLINHYYYYRYLDDNPDAPLYIVFPDQDNGGAAIVASGVGITRHAPHADLARRFVEFLLTDEGLRLFAGVNHEFTTATHLTPQGNEPGAQALQDAANVLFGPLEPAFDPQYVDVAVRLIRQAGLQ